MMRCWTVFGVAACSLVTSAGAQEVVFEGDVVEALLLADGTVMVAEGDRLHVVRSSGQIVAVVGSFAEVAGIAHMEDGGVVAWDAASYAATVFDSDGQESRVVLFAEPGSVIGGGGWKFVGLLADDVGLFQETVPVNPFALSSGSSRNAVRYTTVGRDATQTVVYEVPGDEIVIYHTEHGTTNAPVIFGYGALVSNVGGTGFLVAQTEGEEAVLLDAEGTRVGAVPMPPPSAMVSRDQIALERIRLISMPPPQRLQSVLSATLPPDEAKEMLAAISAASREALRGAPANTVPPRISDLRVDRDRRVWMRRFAPPGATAAAWDVRPLSGDEDEFSVTLPVAWNVFDADGGRMLVGVKEGVGAVTRVLLAPIHGWLGATSGLRDVQSPSAVMKKKTIEGNDSTHDLEHGDQMPLRGVRST